MSECHLTWVAILLCDVYTVCGMLRSSLAFFQKSAAKPFQAPQPYTSAPPYVGSAAPSSMYLSVPPYGSSLFNGSSIPPYEVPFSGGSAYHYNYGNRLSTGSPYRPLHLPAPTPYSSGSLIGNGIFRLLLNPWLCMFILPWCSSGSFNSLSFIHYLFS